MSGARADLQRRIADRIVRTGALDPLDLDRAASLQATYREDLRSILDKLGLLTPDAWATASAEILDIPLLSADDLAAAPPCDGRVTEDFQRENRLVLLPAPDGGWRLAMADPTDRFAVDAVSQVLGITVRPCAATARDIETVQQKIFERKSDPEAEDTLSTGAIGGDIADDDIERLRGLATEAPVIRFVNAMIKRAAEAGASDIHIEPFDRRYSVRYRIDGILAPADGPPHSMGPAIVSRLKILAQLDIAERRLAQDGRIRFRAEGQELDLRVATIPSLHGESVVIRLLEQAGAPPSLADLGMAPTLQDSLVTHLRRRHGLILVTGPTGSGKTTTLYAALNHLNDIERKIITIEDPIEFQIDQVVQTQVKPAIGLDFATVLKSIVRQDPDVIMLGEMRDPETASTAVRSALTGHLVLSTLHTNDAVSAVTRLIDMGVEDYLLTSTVHLCIAQRLVRTLCTACATPTRPSDALKAALERYGMSLPDHQHTVMAPQGCPQCLNRGYRGRTAVYEFFELDDHSRRAILDRSDATALRATARKMGLRTLYEDGLVKVLEGRTTFEEIERLTEDPF